VIEPNTGAKALKRLDTVSIKAVAEPLISVGKSSAEKIKSKGIPAEIIVDIKQVLIRAFAVSIVEFCGTNESIRIARADIASSI